MNFVVFDPTLPRFQNSHYHRHLSCSLHTWLLLLPFSLLQSPNKSHSTHPELSCLLSLAYKVLILTTTQPSYWYKPISVQPARNTPPSSAVTSTLLDHHRLPLNKNLSCRRKAAQCFVSLKIKLSNWSSFKVTETDAIKLGTVSYSHFHSNCGRLFSRFDTIHERCWQTDTEWWKLLWKLIAYFILHHPSLESASCFISSV